MLLAIVLGLPLGHGWGERSSFAIALDGAPQLTADHSEPDSVRPDPVQIASIVRNDDTGSNDGFPLVLSRPGYLSVRSGLADFGTSVCTFAVPDTCLVGAAAPRAPPQA
ncbi:hypothetical protein KKY_354 [Pelagibacterium halotolerans B2]|uniref:Uncharacterized protein n=1 Tax=Pelagibacterium halotolerans (strain DSM 22347 / JCM 15775 / CGMCC 1.7692 / B2) TaxID=1082931 RepID=G4R9H8_PELHB|nr:hypothetical protein KKY_354 [Pelagibacterium halotolerans B2]